jgi:hypothetical protein
MASRRPSLPLSRLRAEEVRLTRRIESIDKHQVALEEAIKPFGGDSLDPTVWKRAYRSSDPHDVVIRNGLTGCYSAIVNNYVEMLKTGSYLAGLTPHKRDHTANAIDVVRDDGGITEKQAERLHQLFVFEGRIQHASPDIGPEEVREAIELMRAEAPGLLKAAVTWLVRHGIVTLTP